MATLHRKLLLPYPPKEAFNFSTSCCDAFSDKYRLPSSLKSFDFSPPATPLHNPYSYTDDHDDVSKKHNNVIHTIVVFGCIIGGSLLFQFLVAFIYIAMKKRSRPNPEAVSDNTQDQRDVLDDDHGPEIDHPIWHIDTVGLQRSVIDSITVFRFRKTEGLTDGTDCSVCLNEFQEDESLRLLPKCSHAFHINCIDTWLISHKNCPLCRAPIVSDEIFAQDHEIEPNLSNPRSITETQMENMGNFTGESSGDDREGESSCEVASGNGRSQETIVEERKDLSSSPFDARNPNFPSRVLSELANKRQENVEPMRRSFSIGSNLQKGNDITKIRFYYGAKLFSSRSARNYDPVLPSQPSDLGSSKSSGSDQ